MAQTRPCHTECQQKESRRIYSFAQKGYLKNVSTTQKIKWVKREIHRKASVERENSKRDSEKREKESKKEIANFVKQ